MNCPHCGQPFKVLPRAYTNVEIYDSVPLVATECCGKPVKIQRQISYRVWPVETDHKVDDWGVPFTR